MKASMMNPPHVLNHTGVNKDPIGMSSVTSELTPEKVGLMVAQGEVREHLDALCKENSSLM